MSKYLGAILCWVSGFCAASAIYTLARALSRPSPERLGTAAFYIVVALAGLWLGVWLVSRMARRTDPPS